MTTLQESNKAIVAAFNKKFIEQGDMDVFHATMHREFINRTPILGQSPAAAGAAHFLTRVLRPAFPDLEITIHDQVAEGDKVVTCKSYSGTHLGEFLGIHATGRAVEFGVIDNIRLLDGRYIEHWAVADLAGLRAQLLAG